MLFLFRKMSKLPLRLKHYSLDQEKISKKTITGKALFKIVLKWNVPSTRHYIHNFIYFLHNIHFYLSTYKRIIHTSLCVCACMYTTALLKLNVLKGWLDDRNSSLEFHFKPYQPFSLISVKCISPYFILKEVFQCLSSKTTTRSINGHCSSNMQTLYACANTGLWAG